MVAKTSAIDESHGQLLLRTGVAGRAAKMGHRLTIAMAAWRGEVSWSGEQPTGLRLAIEVDSLRVLRGDGGLAPLSTPEKALVRSNAVKCLQSSRHPRINFQASDIAEANDGYRLTGTLEICGRTHPHTLEVGVEELTDSWRLRCDSEVRQSDYDVKRYSMLMGAMQVADVVTVSFTAEVPFSIR